MEYKMCFCDKIVGRNKKVVGLLEHISRGMNARSIQVRMGTTPTMSKKILVFVFIIAVAIVVGIFTYGSMSFAPSGPSETSETAENASPVTTSAGEKVFTVLGRNFSFSPAAISVAKGDRVKIVFKDEEGFHDLKIEGYSVGTKRIRGGEEATVEFTADRVGAFEYYCSVGDHRKEGMHGTLMVR